MAYFENERQMYIPLSVEETNVSKTGYFMSNKKIVYMAIGLLPYLVFMYFMMQIGVRIFPIIISTLVYLFGYSYFFRFVILEENRLKSLLYELDNNRYSGVDTFWGINKIGDEGESDGLIYYEKNSLKNTRAYVIHFDRGSTVGVPVGNYTAYREAKQEFMRRLYEKKYDFHWYETIKRKKIPPTLIAYFNTMTKLKNSVHKKLLKLQIDINTGFYEDSDYQYTDYIVVFCHRAKNAFNLRTNLEDIIYETLGSHSYVINPRILNKKEVEEFMEDLLLIKSLDSDHALKGKSFTPFENFGTVIKVLDENGKEMDIEDLNSYDFSGDEAVSLENIMENANKLITNKVNILNKKREMEIKRIKKIRLQDKMSDAEYKERTFEINAKYDEEIYEVENGIDIKKRDEKLENMRKARKFEIEERKRLKEEKQMKKYEPREVELEEDIVINTNEKFIQNLLDKEEEERKEREKEDFYNDDYLDLETLMEMEFNEQEQSKSNETLSDDEKYEAYIDNIKQSVNTPYTNEDILHLDSEDEDEEFSLEDLLDDLENKNKK